MLPISRKAKDVVVALRMLDGSAEAPNCTTPSAACETKSTESVPGVCV